MELFKFRLGFEFDGCVMAGECGWRKRCKFICICMYYRFLLNFIYCKKIYLHVISKFKIKFSILNVGKNRSLVFAFSLIPILTSLFLLISRFFLIFTLISSFSALLLIASLLIIRIVVV